MTNIHRQHLGMVARHRACFHGFNQPLRDQSLRKLALGVFVTENRPPPSGVEQALQLVLIVAAGVGAKLASAQVAIQP